MSVGCSAGDEREHDAGYEREMERVAFDYSQAIVAGFGFVDVDSDEQAAELARGIARDIDRVARRASSITSPEDVDAQHAGVVAALNAEAAYYGAYADSSELPGDPPDDVDQAFRALERAGYDIGWR